MEWINKNEEHRCRFSILNSIIPQVNQLDRTNFIMKHRRGKTLIKYGGKQLTKRSYFKLLCSSITCLSYKLAKIPYFYLHHLDQHDFFLART